YANTPALLGEVVHEDADGHCSTLAVLQDFVRNQGDAWRWTLDFLSRSFDEHGHLTGTDARAEALAGYDAFATALGRRLGELHAVLSQPSDNPDFAPQHADAEQIVAWSAATAEQLEHTLAALPEAAEGAGLASARSALQNLRATLPQRTQALMVDGAGILLTRIHGDFHLGQVLVVQGDAWLIDFEGEPSRALSERRHKSSPLRDVAGLLRSLDYAAAVALHGEDGAAPRDDARFADYLEAFRERATRVFLGAYRDVLDASPQRWVSEAAFAPVLAWFMLDKAAYEIQYEAANRPAWIDVPLHGLLRLAEDMSGGRS
ncbi:MAG: alpha-amylase, partial [Rhodanobacter sp.]